MKAGNVLGAALAQLREERAQLDNAIRELERVMASLGAAPAVRRVGRKSSQSAPSGRGKGWSAQARRAAALRMKRYWAERRKQAQTGK